MPIYEFYCKKCNKIYEYFLNIQDLKNIKNCENCNDNLQLKISIPSFPQFKGSGFYQTDYKNKQ